MTLDQRRRAMAHNRGRTKPERALASALWCRGLRYFTADGYKNRYGQRLLGNPDLIFTRKRIVVFVDGCFWHGCSECKRIPDGYNAAWVAKINRNVERDKRVSTHLQDAGWTVIRIPEHAIHTQQRLIEIVDDLLRKMCLHQQT